MKRKKNHKKINKIIQKIIYAFLLIFVFCLLNIIANKVYKSDFEHLQTADKEMIEHMITVFDTFETSSTEIWTENYRLDKEPVLISVKSKILPFLSRRVYAFNIDLSGKAYSKQIKVSEDIFDGYIYRLAGVYPKGIPLFIYNGSHNLKINGQNGIGIKVNKTSFNNSYIYEKLISGGYEAFVVKNSLMPVYKEITNYDYSKENIGLKGVEFRLTDEILNCRDDSKKLDELLCKFVTIRDARYRLNNEMAFEEPLCEMTLGCGEYSANKLISLIGLEYAYFDKNSKTAFEESFCEAVSGDEYEKYFTLTAPRQTGAAIGFILDKLSLGDGWRSAIENGTSDNIVTPYSILHEYCKQHCEQYGTFNLNQLKKDYGFDIYASLKNF